MKKITVLMLAFVLMISALAGCGSESAVDDSVRVVRVWTSDSGARAIWEPLVADFNSTVGKEKGIKLEWETYGSDYNTVVDVAKQNGQLPDIVTLSMTKLKEYLATGDVVAIDDMPGGPEFLAEYDSPFAKGSPLVTDGKTYGVNATSNVAGLIYNKDLFKKAGIVDENGEALPPKTLEEAREYAKRITNTKESIYGYSFPMKFSMSYILGIPCVTSTGSVSKWDFDNITYDASTYKKPIEWIINMKNDGSLFPGFESLDNDTSRSYFAEGKIGMMAGISWDVSVLTSQFVAKCDWGVAPFPLIDENTKYPAWKDLSGSHMITKTAMENAPEKVMEVYKFIYAYETRKTLYENNARISCKTDVLENADNTKIDPHFEEFANLMYEDYVVRTNPTLKVEGESVDEVLRKAVLGRMTVDEAIEDINNRYTAAFKKGVEDGSIDPSIYK